MTATTFDLDWIHGLMTELADCRCVFHNEADFRQALVRLLHTQNEGHANPIFSEYPLITEGDNRKRLDIWFEDAGVAIELKYHRDELEYGPYHLAHQARGPQVRYDTLKDIERLEKLNLPGYKVGFVILLTNSPSLWNPPADEETIVDKCFRLHKDRKTIQGMLKWGPKKSKQACTGSRTSCICLNAGPYHPKWECYSKPCEKKNGLFKYLAFQVLSPEPKGAPT